MLNVLDVSERYENEWIVLDRAQKVIDHGKDLEELWGRHADSGGRITFYYASGSSR